MLHPALHSQPLRQKERDNSVFASENKNKPILNIQSNKIFIRYTFFFLHAESLFKKKKEFIGVKSLCVCQIPLRTDQNLKLPLAMPVTTRIKTTAVRCIVIRKRPLFVL